MNTHALWHVNLTITNTYKYSVKSRYGIYLNLPASAKASCNVVKLDKILERFWAIEDFDHEPLKSRDDISCEQHYVDHTHRDKTGTYIVRLPFRDSKFQLGESKNQALKRFYALEKKFESNSHLKSEYHKVLNEYILLKHFDRNFTQ